MRDLGIADRSMIWNSDLVEALELENLLEQAVVTLHSAREPHREPRRARARGLPRARRPELAEAHAVLARRRRRRAARLPPGAPVHAVERGAGLPAEGAGVLNPLSRIAESVAPASGEPGQGWPCLLTTLARGEGDVRHATRMQKS